MKSYDKIQYWNQGLFGEDCVCFDKIDGSNFRAEFSRKRGFYKYGSRSIMIDRSSEHLGSGIDIFLNKYSEDLNRIFRDKYSRVDSFVVFGEFIGENSFAGQHVDSDVKDVILFDINQYKRGIITPYEFLENFGHLHIPSIVYEGEYDIDLISHIRENKTLKEGVIAKGILRRKNNKEEAWMTKIKTDIWLKKVKEKFGEKYLMEELNNDSELINLVNL